MQPAARWRPVGQVLVENGSITPEQLEAALEEQKHSRRKIGDILVNSGAITWLTLAHAIAEQAQDLGAPAPPRPTPEAVEAEIESSVSSQRRQMDVEALLKERQRAFLELVTVTETLRAAVEKLQDDLAERDAEIARLRAATA